MKIIFLTFLACCFSKCVHKNYPTDTESTPEVESHSDTSSSA